MIIVVNNCRYPMCPPLRKGMALLWFTREKVADKNGSSEGGSSSTEDEGEASRLLALDVSITI